jgi:outer membrane immunogenic protein
MKKLFSISGLAAAAALAWAGSASAADMPVKAPPAPVAPALYNWSGFYVGVHTGFEWASVRDTQVLPGSFETDSNVRVPIAGFHVGYNWEFSTAPWGGWVIGVEGGLNEPLKENDRGNFGSCANPAFACGLLNMKDNWYAGGRLGVAFNLATGGWLFGGDYLFTVSGGWTTAQFQRQDVSLATGAICSTAVTAPRSCTLNSHDGGYVGVGLEHVWAKGNLVDWIGGVDYQHQFWGDQTDVDVTGVGHTINADADIIRFRTTLKFKY